MSEIELVESVSIRPYSLLMLPGEVRDLRSLIAGGRQLEIEYALYIIIGCCKALPRADPRGVVSPTRILIANKDDVTIGGDDVTQNNFGYLSPEAASGLEQHRQPVQFDRLGRPHGDARAQPGRPALGGEHAAVFALGSILWEMLAGRPLFKGGSDYQTIELVRAADVPPLPEAPPELEAIVRKALAKDVESRYQTAGQFGDALAGYLMARALN